MRLRTASLVFALGGSIELGGSPMIFLTRLANAYIQMSGVKIGTAMTYEGILEDE
jgi:hypothetical protein